MDKHLLDKHFNIIPFMTYVRCKVFATNVGLFICDIWELTWVSSLIVTMDVILNYLPPFRYCTIIAYNLVYTAILYFKLFILPKYVWTNVEVGQLFSYFGEVY